MDPPPRDKIGGDPIESAGLFEGDIAGVSADMVRGRKGIQVRPVPNSTLIKSWCTLASYDAYQELRIEPWTILRDNFYLIF